jgi:GxxExxY protein
MATERPTTYQIIGCAMAVHNELGPGLREGIYQRALAVKLDAAGLAHAEEYPVRVWIDDYDVGLLYLDHLVDESIIVEVKALKHKLTDDEVGQVITYLAATGLKEGILLNFAGKSLEYRRIYPPRKIDTWRQRVHRYTWRPPDMPPANQQLSHQIPNHRQQ